MEETKHLSPLKIYMETFAKERTLIIGKGEIGSSLGNVLALAYDVQYKDKDSEVEGNFNVMNVCIPYSDNFVSIVKEYQKRHNPKLTIIHSTVPVGTSRKCNAVHSPINGKHPNLTKSIQTFIKFVGGNNGYNSYDAVRYLNKAGIRTKVFSSSESTEFAKIMCTTRYGVSIMEMKETEKECERLGVPFHEVYTEWNSAYNEGYVAMGSNQFFRPVLEPMRGEIGGHCVINNCDLANNFLTDLVKGRNQTYKEANHEASALSSGVEQFSGGHAPRWMRNPFTRLDRKRSGSGEKSKDSGVRVHSRRSNA